MDISQLPKTRAAAKTAGATHYFTGVPCKHGHVAPRKTKGACVECLKLEWAAALEKRAEYFKEYNASAAGQAAKQRYYVDNRAQVIARAQARPDVEKRAYQSTWKQKNIVWVRADTKSRRRKHRSATPPWVTREQKAAMRDLYKTAILLSKTTGERYVVDHIVPLRGEAVCGLHVPWNLRVITQAENLIKGNKHLDTPTTP